MPGVEPGEREGDRAREQQEDDDEEVGARRERRRRRHQRRDRDRDGRGRDEDERGERQHDARVLGVDALLRQQLSQIPQRLVNRRADAAFGAGRIFAIRPSDDRSAEDDDET